MEVVYLLTAEIPSEFHCAQITTFHMQHVSKHLTTVMSRKIEYPKIDKRTQKVVDRMSEFSDMNEKEEHEVLPPLNVSTINELRNDIERNNKTQGYYNIVILVITLLSFSIMAIDFFSDDEEQLKSESLKIEYEAKKPTSIDTVDLSRLKHNEELQILQNGKNDSLK